MIGRIIPICFGLLLAHLGFPISVLLVLIGCYFFMIVPFMAFKKIYSLSKEENKEKQIIKAMDINSQEYFSRYMPKV